MTFSKNFWTSKTTWTAILAIVSAVSAAAQGSITWPAAVAGIFAALLTAFHADTVRKAGGG